MASSLTARERRELATIFNRGDVSFQSGDLVLKCKEAADVDRAYDLLTKQQRNPERDTQRRTLVCRVRS